MEALDFSCNTFSGFSKNTLIEITHDYPEWKRYENYFMSDIATSKLIDINDFFINPDIDKSPAIKKYLNGKDPLWEEEEYLKEAKELYFENEEMRLSYR
jgi:hypothetical protein